MPSILSREPSSVDMSKSSSGSKTKNFLKKVIRSDSSDKDKLKKKTADPAPASTSMTKHSTSVSSTNSHSSSKNIFKTIRRKTDASFSSSSSKMGHNLDGVNDILGVSGNVIAAPRARHSPPPLHNNNNNNNNNHNSSNTHANEPPKKKETTEEPPHLGLPSIDDLEKQKKKSQKITYNPYGTQNKLTVSQRLNADVPLSVEEVNVLPFPLADPNDYLPDEFKLENRDLLEEYQYVDSPSLGYGASASVRKVHKIKRTKEVYALKKFILFKGEKPEEFYPRAAKEYMLHKNLSNGNHVVSCISLIKVPHQHNSTRAWGFILECCKTDLFNIMEVKEFRFVPVQEKLCLFKQIMFGIKFIHECGVVHKDIKPENILLSNNGVVKITDFGVSDYGHKIPGDSTSGIKMSTALVGSPPYTPPEVARLQGTPQIRRDPYDPFKMDLWAAGMILFAMFYSGTPWVESHAKRCSEYKEYEQGYGNYMTKNPLFRKNEITKGSPGMDYKYAREFPTGGIARMAWRLCDPLATTRYTIADIFNDPTFQEIEMCIDENEYECNYFHHKEHKCHQDGFDGKVEYGSDMEITVASSVKRQSSFASLYSNNYPKKNSTVNNSTASLPKVKSMLGPMNEDLPSHDAVRQSTTNLLEHAHANGNGVVKTKIGAIPRPTARSVSSSSSSVAPMGHSSSIASSVMTNSPVGDEKSTNGESHSIINGNGIAHSNGDRITTNHSDLTPVPETAAMETSVSMNGDDESRSLLIEVPHSLNGNAKMAPSHPSPAALARQASGRIPTNMSTTSNGTTSTTATTASASATGGPGTLAKTESVALLDCLYTSDGLKPIKLGDAKLGSSSNSVVSTDLIRKCATCKMKKHDHFAVLRP